MFLNRSSGRRPPGRRVAANVVAKASIETLEDRRLLASSAVLLADINPGQWNSTPGYYPSAIPNNAFVNVGSRLLFVADDPTLSA